LRNASELGIEIAAAFSAAADEPAVGPLCRAHGVAFHPIDEPDRRAFDDRLTRLSIDARLDLVVLTFNRIVPPPMVDRYRGRIINMHPALLPSFRGPHPVEDALASGSRFIGATMHEADEEVDHGPIIAQSVVGIARDEPIQSICSRLYRVVRPMFLQTIAWFAEDRIEKDAQGRIWVRGARYGALPTSPQVERTFRD
jgi:phosphoribosylglycinamide formyltransferase-1